MKFLKTMKRAATGSRLTSAALAFPLALSASSAFAQYEVSQTDENTGLAGIINNIGNIFSAVVPVIFMGAGAAGVIFSVMGFLDLKKMSDGQGGGPQGPNWGGIAFKLIAGIGLISLAAFIAIGTESLTGSQEGQFETQDPFSGNN